MINVVVPKKHRFTAEYAIDIENNEDVQIMHFYVNATHRHPRTFYKISSSFIFYFGKKLGPKMLRWDVQTIELSAGEPQQWGRSIERFALTFSEAAQFKWMKAGTIQAFEMDSDIRFDGKY
ncbi:hypothetical protein Tco_0954966 [Tanacetum coccineum]|uniref:Uncharacterized protein n=1 Tax=Tanacetum coccineum TaxID=301880 RepID=A0ABQ5E5W6_9ASTR